MSLNIPPAVVASESSTPASSLESWAPTELTGTLKAGYSSLYEYRGMVAKDTGSGGMVLDGTLAYDSDVPVSPMLSFTYRDMDVLNSNGQVNFFAGGYSRVESSLGDRQSLFRGGYQLISGGLPGVMKNWEKRKHLESSSGTVHEFVMNYTTTHALEQGVLFSSYTGGYAFSGLEGWYLSTSVGYVHQFTEQISAALTGTISWSFSYWERTDGCDQANILFTVPVRVNENGTLSPFIMVDWGAHNVKNINRYTERKIVDNFAVLAGVSYEITF